MGMDVFGNNAGSYYRSNIWRWRPLAQLIQDQFPMEAVACKHWETNDGDGLNADQALILAGEMMRFVRDGSAFDYIADRDIRLESLPRERCDICGGTGIRTDAIGVQFGYDKPRNHIIHTGGCNGCAGEGTKPAWETHYPLSLTDVIEFAEFAAASGGFKIL